MELTKETLKSEVAQFKSAMGEASFDIANKSLTLEKRGEVGVITFDQYQERANKLSTANMLRFFELFSQVADDRSIKALLIIGKKPSIFIAGADISEIQKLSQMGPAAAEALTKLQSVFTYLENLPIPTLVAIHGACMGGGTELSLACDYRMATDAPETRIGLPEVQLGVIPGWGGTQRMPRLMGLPNSLDLILSGRHVDAKTAKRMGLFDKLVPKEFLEEKAMAWASELAKKGKKRSYGGAWSDRLMEKVPGGKWIIFDQAKKKLLEKTKGNYPAPLGALEVIKKTYGGSQKKGLQEEARVFSELVTSPESRSLINVFYLTERVKKDKGTKGAVAGKEVYYAGVLGAGVMGGGIAQLFAAKKVRVRMKDIQWDAVAKGFQAAYRIFKKQVKRRKLKPSECDNLMALIEGTTTWSGFRNVDLVVEAVVEDMNIKKKVFKELDSIVNPGAILATNTSSLSVTEISEAVADPKRVVGMHFFNPVEKMPLVEVIRGKHTSDEAVATIFQFSKKLGKTPIVVKDSPGFVVNRILGPYLHEAFMILNAGTPVAEMDAAMEKFGMPMGPGALLDEIGYDVGLKVLNVLYGAFGERLKTPELLAEVVKNKWLGKKVGKGLYLYEDGERKGPDPEVTAKFVGERGPKLTEEVIQKRLIYLMINEAARCLEEGVTEHPEDVDIGMIFGTGFAPFRGGLLRYADSVGAEAIVGDLEVFARDYGARFKPSQKLQQMAVSKKKFYDK